MIENTPEDPAKLRYYGSDKGEPVSELEDYAERHFGSMQNYAVPLHLLRAWLSENHGHGEDGVAVVPSMALDRWARENAVERIVDKRDLGGDDKDIWSFFQHGWHREGPACKTFIRQSSAPDEADGPSRVRDCVGTGGQRGMLKRSVTTGQLHTCELSKDEDCYWSGDLYASHEMGY